MSAWALLVAAVFALPILGLAVLLVAATTDSDRAEQIGGALIVAAWVSILALLALLALAR